MILVNWCRNEKLCKKMKWFQKNYSRTWSHPKIFKVGSMVWGLLPGHLTFVLVLLLAGWCLCLAFFLASLWMRLRKSRFSNALEDILFDRLYLPVCGSRGRRRRLSFRKVSSCNCACSRRGSGGGGGGKGRPFHSAVFSEPGVSEAPLPCARGDTTAGRIGFTLLTQILKGCGSTCLATN